ncbi:flagellar protein FlaG [Robertmurraya korlensis]|uniref:flagellar protein FlaG n=1 Tax=Robertmurraya korlensis TaxID=519977 RepID=UPI0020415039|nr:flagellar protein FlaG [Robertmurraya korlensis]MCM3602641.1 flagellar protein FlaG [Robertmurraya korlensis]
MIDRISSPIIHSNQNRVEKVEIVNPLETVEEPKQEISLKKERVEEIVKSLNDFLTPTQTSLKFEFHEKLNEYYVTLIDDKTQQTIREIPSKKMLDFYAAMTEFIGLMIDKKI